VSVISTEYVVKHICIVVLNSFDSCILHILYCLVAVIVVDDVSKFIIMPNDNIKESFNITK